MVESTYCRICEAACGLLVERDRDGRALRLLPDRDHPHSAGHVCAKGTRFLEVARHPDRLLHPRVDGARTDWDTAMRAFAERLRPIRERHGPHAIGIYFGNPIAFNSLALISLLAFGKTLGTRNVFSAGSQDCNNKFTGARIVHGSPAIHPVPDFERCELAVVFGSNPYVSQSSFVHLPGGARVFDGIVARGGDVVWIDPRSTESARRCGTHLAIRPGSDVWLMLALLGRLGERAPKDDRADGFAELLGHARRMDLERVALHTGLSAAQIVALADRIASSRATAFHMSVGVNQGGFGTLAYVLLHALAWATGNFDREGGWLVHPMSAVLGRVFRHADLDPANHSRIGGFPATMGTLPGGILADEILEPGDERIRALIVVSGDPLRSVPGGARLRRALESLDTLVAIDMFVNTTGALADIVLPATSWLERWDFASTTLTFQTGGLVQVAGPVLDPPGECRNDARIICDLAAAIGGGHPLWKLGRLPFDRFLPRMRFGVRGPSARAGAWLRRHRLRLFDATIASELARVDATPVPPPSAFTLICRRRRLGHNGWLHGGVRDGNGEAFAWMHRDDMDRLGVRDGDAIEITSTAGSLRLPARANEGLAARTVVVPHGLLEHNINAIIPTGAAAIERVSGQHVMTGIAVDVQPRPRDHG
ncbi:MAG TPA: molybdopterin-dependent oxidoreductase [Nannocystaceae bacterium]|nr:molybdopterin-dependent oxidoreductase [Nannocystaceae bacterium]